MSSLDSFASDILFYLSHYLCAIDLGRLCACNRSLLARLQQIITSLEFPSPSYLKACPQPVYSFSRLQKLAIYVRRHSDSNLGLVVDVTRLPSTLTSLEVRCFFASKWSPTSAYQHPRTHILSDLWNYSGLLGQLPNLERLEVDIDAGIPQDLFSKFPCTLKYLHIGGSFSLNFQGMIPSLPPNLTELVIRDNSERRSDSYDKVAIENMKFPAGLTKLDVQANWFLYLAPAVPENVTSLSLRFYSLQKVDMVSDHWDKLPRGLKEFVYLGSINSSCLAHLPTHLTKLNAANNFKLTDNLAPILPRGLVILKGFWNDLTGAGMALLPPSITSLWPSSSPRPLDDVMAASLPRSLTETGAMANLTPLGVSNLPRTLTSLDLKSISLSHAQVLPPSLTHLHAENGILSSDILQALPRGQLSLSFEGSVDDLGQCMNNLPCNLQSIVFAPNQHDFIQQIQQQQQQQDSSQQDHPTRCVLPFIIPESIQHLSFGSNAPDFDAPSCLQYIDRLYNLKDITIDNPKTIVPASFLSKLPPSLTRVSLYITGVITPEILQSVSRHLYTFILQGNEETGLQNEDIQHLPRGIAHLKFPPSCELNAGCKPFLPTQLITFRIHQKSVNFLNMETYGIY